MQSTKLPPFQHKGSWKLGVFTCLRGKSLGSITRGEVKDDTIIDVRTRGSRKTQEYLQFLGQVGFVFLVKKLRKWSILWIPMDYDCFWSKSPSSAFFRSCYSPLHTLPSILYSLQEIRKINDLNSTCSTLWCIDAPSMTKSWSF